MSWSDSWSRSWYCACATVAPRRLTWIVFGGLVNMRGDVDALIRAITPRHGTIKAEILASGVAYASSRASAEAAYRKYARSYSTSLSLATIGMVFPFAVGVLGVGVQRITGQANGPMSSSPHASSQNSNVAQPMAERSHVRG